MKKLLLLLTIICGSLAATSQKTLIKTSIDNRGLISVTFKENKDTMAYDFMTKAEFNKAFRDQFTGNTWSDKSGNTYPVLKSINGKLFVIRTSKTGNNYRYYLPS